MEFDTAYFLAWVIVFIFGTSLQKFAQAFVAGRLGDSTPRNKGRLTLNPVVHHDPLGLFFAFLLSLGPLGLTAIAWGKPLELNTFRLRGGKLANIIIALIGPLVFFGLAFVFWIATQGYIRNSSDFLADLLRNIVLVNLILCAFNLIPIPPLDAYDIIKAFLPPTWQLWLEKYGILVLIVLVLIVPFFLRVNILFQFYVTPVVRVLAGLLGISL